MISPSRQRVKIKKIPYFYNFYTIMSAFYNFYQACIIVFENSFR